MYLDGYVQVSISMHDFGLGALMQDAFGGDDDALCSNVIDLAAYRQTRR